MKKDIGFAYVVLLGKGLVAVIASRASTAIIYSKVRLVWCMVGLAALLMASGVQASTILFEQTVDGNRGLFSNIGATQQAADNFDLAAPATLSSLQWYGAYQDTTGSALSSLTSVEFQISLFADVSGVPDPTPFFVEAVTATFTSTGIVNGTFFNYPIFRFEANLASTPNLNATTSYWLSILDIDAATASSVGIFEWSPSILVNGSAIRGAPYLAWSSFPRDMAFTLNSNSPVPEPATMLLLGSGLVGLAGFRRKFRKS